MGERDTFEPNVKDFDPRIHYDNPQDRGVGKRLYGERHRFDERESTLHPDEMQIGFDEPTSGAAAEFEREMETEEILREVIHQNADNAGMHFRAYGRIRLKGDLLQQSRDMVHNHRIQRIKDVNNQFDLLRRNGGN